MMYEEMNEKELMYAVFELECETCDECPMRHLCGEHELFYGCSVWEMAMGEDL